MKNTLSPVKELCQKSSHESDYRFIRNIGNRGNKSNDTTGMPSAKPRMGPSSDTRPTVLTSTTKTTVAAAAKRL